MPFSLDQLDRSISRLGSMNDHLWVVYYFLKDHESDLHRALSTIAPEVMYLARLLLAIIRAAYACGRGASDYIAMHGPSLLRELHETAMLDYCHLRDPGPPPSPARFSLFSKLPTELQLTIWELAATPPICCHGPAYDVLDVWDTSSSPACGLSALTLDESRRFNDIVYVSKDRLSLPEWRILAALSPNGLWHDQTTVPDDAVNRATRLGHAPLRATFAQPPPLSAHFCGVAGLWGACRTSRSVAQRVYAIQTCPGGPGYPDSTDGPDCTGCRDCHDCLDCRDGFCPYRWINLDCRLVRPICAPLVRMDRHGLRLRRLMAELVALLRSPRLRRAEYVSRYRSNVPAKCPLTVLARAVFALEWDVHDELTRRSFTWRGSLFCPPPDYYDACRHTGRRLTEDDLRVRHKFFSSAYLFGIGRVSQGDEVGPDLERTRLAQESFYHV